jgi:Ala-tRNA(Pro) deacylase
MTIAPKLRHWLDAAHADYELIAHAPTMTPLETAEVAHVAAEAIAKAVLLDSDKGYLLAVLPADRRLDLHELRDVHGIRVHLAKETDVAVIFDDCALGAIPPLGAGYGIPTIVDLHLDTLPDLYFEAGDHMSLIHLSHDEFARLTETARHGRIAGELGASSRYDI